VSYAISGAVRHAGNGASVAGAVVALQGPVPASTTTGSGGTFAFTSLPAAAWNVRASRADAALTGVSALDAAWALQHAIGARTLSAAQALACDVSANGTVSALDASYILQRLVDVMPAFPAATACGSDWIFTPSGAAGAVSPVVGGGACQLGSFNYAPLVSSVSGAQFDGAAFGDCTLSGGAAAATTAGDGASSPAVVVDHTRRDGRYLRVAIRADGVAAVSALDLTLTWDPNAMRLRGVRRAPGVSGVVHSGEPHRGHARIALASGTPIEQLDRPLVYAVFERRRRSEGDVRVESAVVDELQAAIATGRGRGRR
jgi:hypothetical protein